MTRQNIAALAATIAIALVCLAIISTKAKAETYQLIPDPDYAQSSYWYGLDETTAYDIVVAIDRGAFDTFDLRLQDRDDSTIECGWDAACLGSWSPDGRAWSAQVTSGWVGALWSFGVATDAPATLTVDFATAQVFARAAIPEASTWGLMLLGVGVVGAVLRRNARAVA